ncbi:MAG: exodeoxyribonuclease V subunit beta [Verrucomicrobia bacterium]|nr:exodeoxyribonuclease V subunit beta [Verrucomicrobiota bacterium]
MSANFNLVTADLLPGTTLLQASAGTGKTHTLAGLFLRLIVEQGLEVDEILVVTFTEAATEELRDRIRKTLARAAEDFRSGSSTDELTAALLARVPDRPRAATRLRESLNAFDTAAVFTLHGFCQRLLRDRAFESGGLFDVELVTDQTELLREVADDFWRRQLYGATPFRVALARGGGLTPDALLALLKSSLNHHDVQVVCNAGPRTADECAQAADAALARARELWAAESEIIRSHFGDLAEWANKPYNRSGEMETAFRLVDAGFTAGRVGEDELAALLLFSSSALADAENRVRKRGVPPHVFFDACESLRQTTRLWNVALRREFLTAARGELAQRKERLKVRSYDDLLTRARAALRGDGGAGLVRATRQQFKAALIDEFQDTDPVQWEIFRTLFAAERETSSPRVPASKPDSQRADLEIGAPFLFLIGDPKQAIYSFRGADIFTYLDAAERAERGFTLGTNWRSESGLVGAVNTLFDRPAGAPFVFGEIPFERVQPSPRADDARLTFAGRREPPMQIWFLPRDEKPVAKGKAEEKIVAAVAGEITRLMNSEARIGARPLRHEDIAVLTMTNAQADLVQRALARAGVPGVLHTERSVFESREAGDLLRVLAAIGEPGNEKWLRAALATPLFGESASDLAAYESDEAAWQQRREQFQKWFEMWEADRFAVMFRRLLAEAGVRERLLSRPEGERVLTNTLHLGELLHRAEVEERLGPGGLLKWFAARLHDEGAAADEHQLRLERDDNAVRIVTVHKSKGLQYGIVFAPFCWRDSEPRAGDVVFHDEASHARVRDLGPEISAERRHRAQREALAENVRLLYVALTRAVHRCHFAWGAINTAETSAPAWLLHGHRADGSEPFELNWSEVTDDDLRADLSGIVEKSGGTIELNDLPEADAAGAPEENVAPQPLKARTFTGTIHDDWRVASFSSLTASGAAEQPDYDSSERREAPAEPAAGIFAFPRGARPGTCLHKIFEKLEFAAEEPDVRALVAEQLQRFGFSDREHGAGVAQMVRRVLSARLGDESGAFALSQVANPDRLNELEFHLPMKRLAAQGLARVFGGTAPEFSERLATLGFAPQEGLLKGFLDLLFRFDGKFYLVDWKSNWLGGRVEDYSQSAMAAEMERNFYTLQYHLYVVALKRWLESRVPGFDYSRDFGGVFYLFLRGVEPARPELGIFRDRPSAELVAELSHVLLAEPEEGVQ